MRPHPGHEETSMNNPLPVPADAVPLSGRFASPRHEPAPQPSSGVDARLVLDALRRRWLVLAGTVVVITSGALGYALTREPVFSATAKVMVGVPNPTATDLGSLVIGTPVNQERIQNELQILQSRELARRVIERAGLEGEPAFNPALDDPARAGTLAGLWAEAVARLPEPRSLLQRWGLMEPPVVEGPLGREPIEDVVDAFLAALAVWPEGRSHVINVKVETRDPQLAARAANAVARAYIDERHAARLDTMSRASGWLDGRIEALRIDAEEKEAAVEAFRSRAGLVATEGSGLAAERIAELNREMAIAQAAEAQAEARWLKVRETLASEGVESVPEVLASATIRELRAAESVAAARLAELGRELGPRHPQMVDARSQLESIRAQLREETQRILAGVRNAYEIEQARVARIERNIAALEERLRHRNDAEAQLRVLQREAEAAQDVYRTFLMRANTGGQQEGLEAPDARLISAAEVPARPAGPQRKLLVMLGFIGACFTGVGLAFALELLDGRFRTADQVRQRLRLPVLAVVPMLSSLTRTRRAPQDHVVDGPDTAFGEAIRALRTSMALSGDGAAPRAVMLTSSIQGEGKTTLCLSVGRHAALSGRRVIVVDCDLRLPRVHEGLGVDNGPGVIDFLSGTPLADLIRVDRQSGLHFISAGIWRRNAPELLRQPRLRELVGVLRSRYELVLIDTPPLLPISDAAVLAGQADLALLVVGWPNARPETVEVAADRLRAATVTTSIAAVFNNVDVKRASGYGFAEIEGYRSRYARYYAAA
jgi:polysaccharide biosynthesis transport protein